MAFLFGLGLSLLVLGFGILYRRSLRIINHDLDERDPLSFCILRNVQGRRLHFNIKYLRRCVLRLVFGVSEI
jgi:hypothetical protein